MNQYISYGERTPLLKKFDKISTISCIVLLPLLIVTLVFLVFELPAHEVIKNIVYSLCVVYYIFQMVFNILLAHFAEPIEHEFSPSLTIYDFVNGFKSATEGHSAHDKYYRDVRNANDRGNMWSIRYCGKYINECETSAFWYALLAVWFIFCVII